MTFQIPPADSQETQGHEQDHPSSRGRQESGRELTPHPHSRKLPGFCFLVFRFGLSHQTVAPGGLEAEAFAGPTAPNASTSAELSASPGCRALNLTSDHPHHLPRVGPAACPSPASVGRVEAAVRGAAAS